MKLRLSLGIGLTAVAAVCGVLYVQSQEPPVVKIAAKPTGLSSVTVAGVEILENADFRVEEVHLAKPDGDVAGNTAYGTRSFDPQKNELTAKFEWGEIKTSYAAEANQLKLTEVITNTSSTTTIKGIRYVPITFRFPEKIKEYDGNTPLLVHNIGQVGAVAVSYGSGRIAIASDEVDKPLIVGFPWAINRPTNTIFPLSINTDRVQSFPDSLPLVVRPIPPNGTDRQVVTLRFGRKNVGDKELLGDVYHKFAEAFPSKLDWSDRRPIGSIVIATQPQGWTTNPRGWFGDTAVNVITAGGAAKFRQRILELADSSIAIMRQMDAQGMITRDIEGQEYPAANYVGDPRLLPELAPEMDQVADAYFARFREAGFKVGICVRPQNFERSADKKMASQRPASDPAQLLIEKIAYAKKRWGITMVAIDANLNPDNPNPMDPAVIQKVADAFPDTLLIPEHAGLRYYAFSAPSGELRQGVFTTPAAAREVYPKAFSLIYTIDGPLDLYKDSLKDSVKQGDVMVYRTWFHDSQNDKVKALYSK